MTAITAAERVDTSPGLFSPRPRFANSLAILAVLNLDSSAISQEVHAKQKSPLPE